MRHLLATWLFFAAGPAFAGTVVEIAPVEVRPVGAQSQAVSPVLQLGPASLSPSLQPALLTTLAAPSVPTPAVPVAIAPIKAISSLQGAAARLVPAKTGRTPRNAAQHGELRSLYDGEAAASTADDGIKGAESSVPAALTPYKPGAPSTRTTPPKAAAEEKKDSRFPLRRGEIGWREFFRLVSPNSALNTVRTPIKLTYERNKEAQMWRQNAGYAFGFRPRNYEQEQAHQRRLKRTRDMAEARAKVLAAYGLPPFAPLAPPLAVLGAKLGSGGQGAAYRAEGRPGRAIKVFTGASGEQLQEMAAILDAVADQGFGVERVTLVRLSDGSFALEMRNVSYEAGWSNLATYLRARTNSAETRAAERKAEDILHAVGAETKRVLGFNAADWKGGFAGPTSDDHLENFVINRKTGEVSGFDTLVKW